MFNYIIRTFENNTMMINVNGDITRRRVINLSEFITLMNEATTTITGGSKYRQALALTTALDMQI